MLCPPSEIKRICLFSFISSVFAADISPQIAKWSSESYGPDGPWQAVTISIGTPPQNVDLLPGGDWMTHVLAPTACSVGVACSDASLAGFYNESASKTPFEISETEVYNNGTRDSMVNLNAKYVFESMSIQLQNGVVGDTGTASIKNYDLLVMSTANEALPDGTTYPVQVGKLALGAPDFNQTWNHGGMTWNGTLLTSALFQQGKSPSNSYGLHIGSVAMGIRGSLNLGGFDQNRVLGPISSQPYSIERLPIDLLDIGIGVAEGASPFNFTSQSGLLAKGNSSIGVFTSVLVEAAVKYLYLPQSTCDAITQFLPVTYQKKYGLYFWNTEDVNYKRIVSSPSFLSFTFRLSGSTSQNVTIKVPFSLLNLTLTSPIINTPTQYLPLRPGLGPHRSYELGRAFMQAAFVGVNWQTSTGDGKGAWFLAQAPGPNTPSVNAATTIQGKDTSIVGSTSAWKDTWAGAWTVLDSGTSTNSSVSGSPSPTAVTERKMSTGAIAGMASVIGILVLLSIAAGIFFFHKRRQARRKLLAAGEQISSIPGKHSWAGTSGDYDGKGGYIGGGFGPRELETGALEVRPVEVDGNSEYTARELEAGTRRRVEMQDFDHDGKELEATRRKTRLAEMPA